MSASSVSLEFLLSKLLSNGSGTLLMLNASSKVFSHPSKNSFIRTFSCINSLRNFAISSSLILRGRCRLSILRRSVCSLTFMVAHTVLVLCSKIWLIWFMLSFRLKRKCTMIAFSFGLDRIIRICWCSISIKNMFYRELLLNVFSLKN